MSRGLGTMQREIKRMLEIGFALHGPFRFADIRMVYIAGGRLTPTRERAHKRALKNLVDRGDVLILSGHGGVADPYRYVTVESFAKATGEAVRDTAHAKQIVAEMVDAVAALGAKVKTATDKLKTETAA